MKVKAKVNIILEGHFISEGEVFSVKKEVYNRIKNLVEVVEETMDDKKIVPEEVMEKKVVKKTTKKKK